MAIPEEELQRRPYLVGYEQEVRARKVLEAHGWTVTRSPMSWGPFDLLAERDGVTALVQVKASPRLLSPAEWSRLYLTARKEGAVPVWCWRPKKYAELHWLQLIGIRIAYSRHRPAIPWDYT
jgi:Holliday junction resolvase